MKFIVAALLFVAAFQAISAQNGTLASSSSSSSHVRLSIDK